MKNKKIVNINGQITRQDGKKIKNNEVDKFTDSLIEVFEDNGYDFVGTFNQLRYNEEDTITTTFDYSLEQSNKTTIIIPKKPEGTKDLEIVLKAGQSYSIENNSGCELIVKFE